MRHSRTTLYICTPREPEVWAETFRQEAPELEIRVWPEAVDCEAVEYVAAWSSPADFFRPFTGLKAIFALSAGVDRLLFRDDLPAEPPLVRVTDAGMAQQMIEYVLFGVLRYHRNMDVYGRQQAESVWRQQPPRAAEDVRVTVLGLGEMGQAVARTLAQFGYRVSGWSRTARNLAGIRCVHGEGRLEGLLGETDILASILPSTPATRGLLNRERLAQLAAGAAVINAGRGDLMDVAALVELLDSGHLRGAMLDVVPAEPLPATSPVWGHPKVLLTPHIAANTLPLPSVRQIVDRIRRMEAGLAVEGVVRRDLAY